MADAPSATSPYRAALVVAAVLLVVVAGIAAGGVWLGAKREARLGKIHQVWAQGKWTWGLARGARRGDLRPWDEAVKAARAGLPLLKSRLVDDETREKTQGLVTDIENERLMAAHGAEAATKERRLADRLVEIQTLRGGPYDEGVDAEPIYEIAFRNANCDIEKRTSRDVAGWMGGRPPRLVAELAIALEDWATLRREMDVGDWKLLVELARLGDRDRGRMAVRRAILAENRSDLVVISAKADLDRLPAPSALQLARLRADMGNPDGAIAVLRAAAQRFPDDVWVNYRLAQALATGRSPDLREAIRFYTAARAIRPETAHALAHALERQGSADEALGVFRDLARRKPEVGRHHLCLAAALAARRQTAAARAALDAAVAACRKTIKAEPDDAATHCDLGIALREKKDLAGAALAFREALRLKPDDTRTKKQLGALTGP